MLAVQATLYKQPEVLISRQDVQTSRGSLQMEAGAFDPTLTGSFDYGVDAYAPTYWENYLYGIGDRTYTTTESSVSLTKKTRYGFSFGPSVAITRSHGITDYMIPTSSNQAIVLFSVNVPLLKGAGKVAADAEEMAARETLEATLLDLEQTISKSVLSTTQAYWAYLAALEALEVFRRMEGDARQTLEDTRLLVRGNEQPASDLETFEANLAQKTSQRVAAEQDLFQARQNHGSGHGTGLRSHRQPASSGGSFSGFINGHHPFHHHEPRRTFSEGPVKTGRLSRPEKTGKRGPNSSGGRPEEYSAAVGYQRRRGLCGTSEWRGGGRLPEVFGRRPDRGQLPGRS